MEIRGRATAWAAGCASGHVPSKVAPRPALVEQVCNNCLAPTLKLGGHYAAGARWKRRPLDDTFREFETLTINDH